MRRFVFALGLVLAACEDPHFYTGDTSEIVFGLEQSSTGLAAGYEILGLANQSGSAAMAFRDGDGRGRCWYERLDARLGRPQLENGVATWTGASLPRGGLTVLANQPGLTKSPGQGWTSTDTLSFYAEGFAMPPLERVTMRAPLVDLAIGTITPAPDAGGALALTGTSDVTVAWTPPAEDRTGARVMVTLSTERAEVRCFDDAANGSTTIGASWVEKILQDGGDAGGKMFIASHRQTTLYAEGGWIVYVVAAHTHREIPFTGIR